MQAVEILLERNGRGGEIWPESSLIMGGTDIYDLFHSGSLPLAKLHSRLLGPKGRFFYPSGLAEFLAI